MGAHKNFAVTDAYTQGFRNFHAGCCGFVATRPDGSQWPIMVALPDGSMMHGMSAAVVLAQMIPGYEQADPDRREELRRRHAKDAAEWAQRHLIASAQAAGDYDPENPDDADLAWILTLPKDEPVRLQQLDEPDEGPEPDARPAADESPKVDGSVKDLPAQAPWLASVPLVCLTTTYAPHTEVAPIPGRVRWIDPSHELDYLRTLGEAGAYAVWIESPPPRG